MATKVETKSGPLFGKLGKLEPACGHDDGKGNYVVVQAGKTYKYRIIKRAKRHRGL